jgi:ABC transporter substrate binding protein (PQQ-dependent alcohol dehydrogenase system)
MTRGAMPFAVFVSAWFIQAVSGIAQTPALRDVRIVYLESEDDPAYRAPAIYAGLYRKSLSRPFPAADVAIKDTSVALRAAGLRLVLERKTLSENADAVAAARDLSKVDGTAAVVLDLPLDEMSKVAQALGPAGPILVNIRHRDDELRTQHCKTRLIHTIPSWSMYTDALAQGLMAADWRNVLVLDGPLPEDQRLATAFSASAKKFGLKLAARRGFVQGNDPRKRDQINVRLLTGGVDYDVVFIADSLGDFARMVPFNTQKPRPVVGSAGWTAQAWHPYWERHGAPQLNRRFAKAAGRTMTDEDWATWIGVRMVADALIAVRGGAIANLLDALLGPQMRLELYKGVPGSIRPWSRQLRQAMLLATHDAVTNLAPVEGALHQKNHLDTLGPDEPEFRCTG